MRINFDIALHQQHNVKGPWWNSDKTFWVATGPKEIFSLMKELFSIGHLEAGQALSFYSVYFSVWNP